MNFSISAIIKWFHDAIFGHEERIAALEAQAGVTPAVAPTPPAPPEVAAHVAAAGSLEVLAISDGVVGTNGVKALWKGYAGQLDRVAFPAITIRIGRALTDAEVAAAYAAGIVRSASAPQPQGPAGDPHAGFDRDADTVPFGGVTIHARGPSQTLKIVGIPAGLAKVQIHGGEVDPSLGPRPPFVRYKAHGQMSPVFSGVSQAWAVDAALLSEVTVEQFADLDATIPFAGIVNVQVNGA